MLQRTLGGNKPWQNAILRVLAVLGRNINSVAENSDKQRVYGTLQVSVECHFVSVDHLMSTSARAVGINLFEF